MGTGSSNLVRAVALEKYVHPAIASGRTQFSVAVKDVMKDLQGKGFPAGNYPQVCTALRTGKFLRENDLEIESIDGPPSGLSTTVVIHYRVTGARAPSALEASAVARQGREESSEERAYRLTENLRGLLSTELQEYGGGEAFLRWIRGEDEPDETRPVAVR